MINMFNNLLPNDFVQQVASTSVQVMQPIAPTLELILGVLIAGVLVALLIRVFMHH